MPRLSFPLGMERANEIRHCLPFVPFLPEYTHVMKRITLPVPSDPDPIHVFQPKFPDAYATFKTIDVWICVEIGCWYWTSADRFPLELQDKIELEIRLGRLRPPKHPPGSRCCGRG